MRASRRFTRLYGAGPLHAVLMLASFALAGYVVARVLEVSNAGWIAVWLAGAIVAHDLVLFPLYTGADRLLSGRRRRLREPLVSWRNHVRVPAVLSGVLLLITFPLVFALSEPTYLRATGLHTSPYLGRWLIVAACLFAGSGVAYVVRRLSHRRGRQPTPSPPGLQLGDQDAAP